MYCLLNLNSQRLLTGTQPWEFVPETPIPDEVRTDKAKRDAWINTKSLKHHVYTFAGGVNNNLRIQDTPPSPGV